MYDFVFFLFYSQQIQKNRSEGFSRHNGSLIASFAIFIHIALIFAVTRKIIFPSGEGYGLINPTLVKVMPIAILIVGFFYYNRNRSNIILKKYNGNLLPVNTANVLKLILIVFVPLTIAAILSVKPH